MPSIKYEKVTSAQASQATAKPEGTLLLDELSRVWLPTPAGGHFMPGPEVGGGALLATDGNSMISLATNPATAGLVPSLDIGFVNWGMALSQHALRWVEQRALSGSTTAESTARLGGWLPWTTANHLLFMEGVNSITYYVTQGLSESAAAQAAFEDFLTYVRTVKSYGKFKRMLLCTIPPRNLTAGRNAGHDLYNRMIRSYCASDGFAVLVDVWKVVVDPASTTFFARSNYLSGDNLHPSAKGARAIGAELARVINLLGLPASNLIATSQLTRATDSTALYINSNPMLLGTPAGGAQLLNGATGLVAPGWRAGMTSGSTMTAVASVVADSDGIGNAQRLTITGATSGSIAQIGTNTTEALPYQAANDWFKTLGKVRWTNAENVSAIYCRINATTTSSLTLDGLRDQGSTVAVALYDSSDMTVPFFMTTPYAKFPGNIPVNTTLAANWYVLFGAGDGTITIDISRGGLINVGQGLGEY